ncbi:hypothetical protein Tco_1320016, partial [Tanacetum coccineum]
YGNPVEGPNFQGCALWRKKLKEVWFTICHENGIYQDLLNTYESSDDDTNVVNAPREPFVVKQNPGENSSQSPPQINHNCCYECGDSLDGIFCQQCTCKSCGKGAHIGYNCLPKAPIISNPEPCNQTIDELSQTLPSFDLTCYSEKENSLPYVSKPNFVDDSPNVFDTPPQPPMYSCEFYGNDARYGHYCTPRVPFINPETCYNQDFNFSQDFHDVKQEYLCCETCGGPHEAFQCQPLNYYEPNPCFDSNYSGYDQFDNSHPQQFLCCENCRGPHEIYQCQPMNEDYYLEQNSCYGPNYFGFDQFQPPRYTVNRPIFNDQKDFLNSQNKLMEQMTSIRDMVGQYIQKKEEENRIEEEQEAKDRYWKIPVCYDDDDDEESYIPLKDIIISGLPPCVAITTVLFTEDPIDSLIIEDEYLDTIPETESDELIKSSAEDLVQIPSESEDPSEGECDLPPYDDSSKNHDLTFSNPLFDIDEDFTSSDESFSEEDVPNENFKIFSNPLFNLDEEITSTKVDQIGDEDNSSPRPSEEFNSENPTESFFPSPIPIKDSDSLMEEIDIFLDGDDSIPPEIQPLMWWKTSPWNVPNILPTHPDLLIDFDFIPSLNDLGSDLDVSSPSGDSNKIYDPGICIEVESTRILDTLSPRLSRIFEASRARGFYPSITRASNPQLHLGIQYPNLID